MHNYGEALVDRGLVEKVRYAKQAGIREVGMISNGSLITDDVARGLVEAGMDAINISLDAAGKDVFESTRVGLKYDQVIAGIERLLHYRDASGKRRPKLILSFVRQNNSNEEQAFIEQWGKRADKIHITDLHNWAGTLNAESDVNYPCYRPWLTLTVLWDGRVSLCCADFDGRGFGTCASRSPRSGTMTASARCGAPTDHGEPSIANRATCLEGLPLVTKFCGCHAAPFARPGSWCPAAGVAAHAQSPAVLADAVKHQLVALIALAPTAGATSEGLRLTSSRQPGRRLDVALDACRRFALEQAHDDTSRAIADVAPRVLPADHGLSPAERSVAGITDLELRVRREHRRAWPYGGHRRRRHGADGARVARGARPRW
jgi:hypothetical protein